MIGYVLDATGTSPSLIWSGPGTMRGTTSPTRTDAADPCALTTHRWIKGVLMDLIIIHSQRAYKNSIFPINNV